MKKDSAASLKRRVSVRKDRKGDRLPAGARSASAGLAPRMLARMRERNELRRADCRFAAFETPHPFQVVEAAHFRAEEVDDNVTGVDQDPIGGR